MEKKKQEIKMSYAELEFRVKRETEKRLVAEGLAEGEKAKGQRRELMIIVLLNMLGREEVEIKKTDLAAAVGTEVAIMPFGDKFTIKIK